MIGVDKIKNLYSRECAGVCFRNNNDMSRQSMNRTTLEPIFITLYKKAVSFSAQKSGFSFVNRKVKMASPSDARIWNSSTTYSFAFRLLVKNKQRINVVPRLISVAVISDCMVGKWLFNTSHPYRQHSQPTRTQRYSGA